MLKKRTSPITMEEAQIIADREMEEDNAEADKMSKQEVYDLAMKFRKEDNLPILSFEEFWGSKL